MTNDKRRLRRIANSKWRNLNEVFTDLTYDETIGCAIKQLPELGICHGGDRMLVELRTAALPSAACHRLTIATSRAEQLFGPSVEHLDSPQWGRFEPVQPSCDAQKQPDSLGPAAVLPGFVSAPLSAP